MAEPGCAHRAVGAGGRLEPESGISGKGLHPPAFLPRNQPITVPVVARLSPRPRSEPEPAGVPTVLSREPRRLQRLR